MNDSMASVEPQDDPRVDDTYTTVTSAIQTSLPLSLSDNLRFCLLIILVIVLMYGLPFNIVLMATIIKVRQLRTRVNTLLFCLSAVDAFNCTVVSLAFICSLLNLTGSKVMMRWAFCTIVAAGILFTNTSTFMILAAMAIVRKRSVTLSAVTKRYLKASIVIMFSFSIGLSIYYSMQKGVSVYVCMNPYGHIAQGKNFIMFILMLPFIVCVGLTMHSYIVIIQVRANRLRAIQPTLTMPRAHIPSFLKPMMVMFISFCICYCPILIHAGLRRTLGMGPVMAHAQLVVNVFNCLGHAFSSSVFCYQSSKLRAGLMYVLSCTHNRQESGAMIQPQGIEAAGNPIAGVPHRPELTQPSTSVNSVKPRTTDQPRS